MDENPTPSGDGTIEVRDLSKRYRRLHAVDRLTFVVHPRRVTGFLGPNGAGKTTTLRMILNLAAPTSGTATVGGRRYVDLSNPTRVVGAMLDGSGAHGRRSGRDHLRVLCSAAGLPFRRADEALDRVGLADAGRRLFSEYSLGMRQRLNLAQALLGDPRVLILDEPANGLDPEGIVWMRELLRSLAADGRTVFVSSHLIAEIEQTAHDLIIINHGKLLLQGTTRDVVDSLKPVPRIRIRVSKPVELRSALLSAGAQLKEGGTEPDVIFVQNLDIAAVAALATAHGGQLSELSEERPALEHAYLTLTSGKASVR